MGERNFLNGCEPVCTFSKMNVDCLLMLPDNKFTSEEVFLRDTRAQEDMLPSYSQAYIQVDVV